MVRRKRTFGDLKYGSYIWSANRFGIDRRVVTGLDVIGDNVRVKISNYLPSQTVNKDARAIEVDTAYVYWFVDRNDAINKSIELQENEIQRMLGEVDFARQRLERYKSKIK